MKVAILTDTNSGIDEIEAKKLGIYVINMPVIIDGVIYYKGKNLTEPVLCETLNEKKAVTTSQPSMGDVIKKWESLFDEGFDEIVYIPMSSGLSGSCNSAKIAAEMYEGKVLVVDNRRISVTQRESVLKALKMANEKMSAKEIADYLEKDAYNSSIYITVDNLDHLKAGGRITAAAAAIATVLNIKPVLTIQGEKIDCYVKLRGNIHRAQLKMLDAVKEDIKNRFESENLKELHIGVVGFGISEEERKNWLEMAKEAFPENDVYYNILPASIGTHTGPGAVGIGVSADYED